MTQEEIELYEKVICIYGKCNQVVVAIEELSELQKELCKYLRDEASVEHISEETADVEIMLEQLKLIFGNEEKIRPYREYKLKRLEMRLEDER